MKTKQYKNKLKKFIHYDKYLKIKTLIKLRKDIFTIFKL
ncbi:hypothetical protein BVAVS116_0434 [Borreliella valaisiana VS116]|uniref:Uncharacterized protein n=1 Tax=Borreliella valaisiana VS116 TaxID=445987 RepID=D6RXR8_BORVA|nr:hypothetical protein BVAVS116_0434 [Borreliella valaisiana VS116]